MVGAIPSGMAGLVKGYKGLYAVRLVSSSTDSRYSRVRTLNLPHTVSSSAFWVEPSFHVKHGQLFSSIRTSSGLSSLVSLPLVHLADLRV